ncbi:hypothetical protein ERAN111884_08520 [Erysipelothrix anatis]
MKHWTIKFKTLFTVLGLCIFALILIRLKINGLLNSPNVLSGGSL